MIDPTQTTALRKRFEGEASRRFRRLKGRIRAELIEKDGFGLISNQGRFEFTRDDDKISAFMQWLEEAERDEILTVSRGTPLSQAGRQAWTHLYVESAYQRGIAQAGRNLRKSGVRVEDRFIDAAFNRPIHADRIGLIYVRAYQELEGITDAMNQQISRVLAEGLSQGLNPRDIARNLNNRVDKIGIARARVLARTEVISAHAEATLNAYKEAGVQGVSAQAEFATAGDDRVCEECESLEGTVRPIDEARGLIPQHPNCRCAWLPVIEDGRGIELR